MKELTERLSALRRLLVLEGIARCLVRYGTVVFGILLMLALWNVLTAREILTPAIGWALAALALLYPVIHALGHRPSLAQTAVEFDRRAGTGDRLITTWNLSQSATPKSSGLIKAAINEGAEHLRSQSFQNLLRLPRPWHFLVLLAVALATPAVLQVPTLLPGDRSGQAPRDLAQQTANREIARQLRESAQAFAPLADTRQDTRALQALEDAARRLETASPARAEELRKQALTQLSAVEAAVRGALGATQQMNLSPSDMSQLAAALQGLREFQRAGRDLAAGRPADAGRELQDSLTRLQQEARDPQDAVRPVSRALAQSSVDPNAPASGGAESPLMQQLMSEDAAAAAEALQQIARQLQNQGRRNQSGSQQMPNQGGSASQQLGKMLRDLAQMKDQARGEQRLFATSDSPESGETDGQQNPVALVNSQGAQGEDPSATLMMPTGSYTIGAQDQQDFGTSEPLADNATMEISENREASDLLRATPLLDNSGETLQSLTLSSGDFSQGSAEYRQIYDQARPFVEEAIQREDVPLGSRELVKRYFENIRPQ